MVFFDPRPILASSNVVDVVQEGMYVCLIDDTFVVEKPEKTSLKVNLTILSPSQHKGKKVSDWLDLRNKNEKVEWHAKKRFAGLLASIGMGDKPLNAPFMIEKHLVKVSLSVNVYNNVTRNRFEKYLPVSENEREEVGELPKRLEDEIPLNLDDMGFLPETPF